MIAMGHASYKYRLKYYLDTHPGEWTKADLEADKQLPGGCDALLFASVLFPPDGSLCVQFFGSDGRQGTGGPLPVADLFRVWAMLTLELAESEDLEDGPRRFVRNVHETLARILHTREPTRG